MEFANPESNSLVIPQGATTGARIEINVDDSGEIDVFNNDGNEIAVISGKDETTGAFTATEADGSFETGLTGIGLQVFRNGGGGIFTPWVEFDALDTRYMGWNTQLAGGVAFDTQTGSLVWIKPGTATAETWTNIGGVTNWSVITGQYMHGITQNVKCRGRIDYTGTTVTGASAAIVSTALPTGYRPTVENEPFAIPQYTSGMVFKGAAAGVLRIDGTIQIYWNNGVATGDRFYLNNLDVSVSP